VQPDHGDIAVLVPVKAFAAAKLRLAPALDPPQREALARSMAQRVLLAAGDLPVAIACDDEDVREWAIEHGTQVVWTPDLGLNGAVEAGVTALAAAGFGQVVVAHADLPLATDLAWLARFGGVTLVPDRHDDGTNVACVPARSGFRFSYGAASFHRHRTEARRLALPLHIARVPALGWDVDVPEDLNYTPVPA
jgi:2-phospho-L-lactate guanylyltransferase